MKKILCVWAVCMMAVMIGCKNKGKTEAATAKDSVTAVIDSIIEENDTTPMPMFLMGSDQYAHMLAPALDASGDVPSQQDCIHQHAHGR